MRERECDTVEHVYIALGSNVGDRVRNIELAVAEMRRRGINILRTSNLYETEPMYHEDQERFLNGVCEIHTNLEPLPLLDTLKDIENTLGRKKSIEKGPRSIDLDILLYKQEVFNHERLSIPHKGIAERSFVLKPLCDLIPNSGIPASSGFSPVKQLLSSIQSSNTPLYPVTPLNSRSPLLRSHDAESPTKLMAILNLTPDSFSNDGLAKPGASGLIAFLETCLESKISVIDIGGQSTRPGASVILPLEESARILPTIQYIRSLPQFESIALSIDTFHSSVARAAISAGADLINDVSGALLDPDMLATAAELNCSIILMHMRGTPQTMTRLTDYPQGVVQGVGSELLTRVTAAEAAGIPRWRIILDPGLGFAKTGSQSLELLRSMNQLRSFPGLEGLPWVVGPSRKGFVGKATGVKVPEKRVMGTAVAVGACIQQGVEIVRVHDVKAMCEAARMGDALFRARIP